MTKNAAFLALLLTSALLAACAVPSVGDPLAGKRLSPPPADHVAVLTHPDRPADDFAEDAARKPSDVLAFIGIDYGMTVVELEAGWGYYTELFAHTVGPQGKVFMQNPLAFDAFFGDAIEARLSERLTNVQAMRTNFDEITVADNSADIVTWFLGPHDLWFRPQGAPAEVFGNPDESFAEIVRVLKPGGVFVVIDHKAAPGTPPKTGGDTQRIDPAIVKDYAKRAGLEFVEESDLLANSEDDYTISVYDSSVRRKTDRFIFKFRKTG